MLNDFCILIIENDYFQLRSLANSMEKSKAKKVLVANNAEFAKKILNHRSNTIDIIISDINMPGLEGIELIPILSKLHFKMPVIFLNDESSFSLYKTQKLANKLHINIIFNLIKPVSSDSILPLINNFKVEKEILSSKLIRENESITSNQKKSHYVIE